MVVDSIRGTWVLPPETKYRWTSEGYATTQIGPLGMPGRVSPLVHAEPDSHLPEESKSELPAILRSDIASASLPLRVALWGDSQVEGVCVSDQDKLFAITEQLSRGKVEVFPLARSGQDAADWLTQLTQVEQHLSIDLHVFLVVDTEDLLAANDAPRPPPSQTDVAAANAAIASRFPAFVIQAARNLLTEGDGSTRRSLRFRPGPVVENDPILAEPEIARKKERSGVKAIDGSGRLGADLKDLDTGSYVDSSDQQVWDEAMLAIRSATSKPIWILDAPVTPEIVDGRLRIRSSLDSVYRCMVQSAAQNRILVLSARELFLSEASQGRWPHGFHNGRFGSGHLNPHGNFLLAEILFRAIADQMLVGIQDTHRFRFLSGQRFNERDVPNVLRRSAESFQVLALDGGASFPLDLCLLDLSPLDQTLVMGD